MQSYFGVAKDTGITDAEIGAVQSIVMAVMAGQVRARFAHAREDAISQAVASIPRVPGVHST